MRVLFVTHNVPRFEGDAAGSFVLRLAVALQQTGVAVHIIAPGGTGLGPRAHIEGVSIERVPYAADAAMTLAYSGTMVEQVQGSWGKRVDLLQLMRALRSATHRALAAASESGTPYDLVHAHWWFPAALALWHGASTPRVVTMHGSDVRLAQRLRPAQRLMRAVLADCAARTAVSSWLANAVQTIAPQLQVDVAPMPVDTARFVPPTNDAARAGVLFVGRLNAQKGTADLIDALGHPALREASLVVVGDGPDRAVLEQRAIDNGSAPRITWRGTLTPTELVALYQGARVVAMPSRDEGLGLVAVEAQLCGTPVVAYASGGLTDVVRTDAGGALVAAGDTEALARALAAVVHDPAEGARRGQLARAQVLSRFSPAAVASAYRAVYERVQAPPRAGT